MRKYLAVVAKLRCPSSSWMVRTSVPDSSKCAANACRSECGVIGLTSRHRRCACWQARCTVWTSIWRLPPLPGNSHRLGRATRHQRRRISRSLGECHRSWKIDPLAITEN
jgi:hypothetical protein